MANKTPYSIADQIALLKQRGMHFNDEQSAHHFLENISYYRSEKIVLKTDFSEEVSFLTLLKHFRSPETILNLLVKQHAIC